ncbi:DUF4956 domain-containing protein [Spirosoma oryzae]|nr:DUF4956 domain-containing protein [Spirosoma oryzae]
MCLLTQSLVSLLGLSDGLLLRAGIDLLTIVVLVRLIYYRIYRKTDLFLTFFAFNFVIFLITYLLNQVQLSIGAAFGLFAVFSMLRYRTEGLSAKDMTYLFVVIAIGLIAAVHRGNDAQLLAIHGAILLCVFLLESNWLFRREWSKAVLYDRLDLLAPALREQLLHDLRMRTGLPAHRIEIQELDLLKDAVRIILYYYTDAQSTKTRTPADSLAR